MKTHPLVGMLNTSELTLWRLLYMESPLINLEHLKISFLRFGTVDCVFTLSEMGGGPTNEHLALLH